MNDPEPPAGPIKPVSLETLRSLSPVLFDRLCELFPGGIETPLNVTHYLMIRAGDIRHGSWMLVHDDKPTGIITIKTNTRLSDIWPQSKS